MSVEGETLSLSGSNHSFSSSYAQIWSDLFQTRSPSVAEKTLKDRPRSVDHYSSVTKNVPSTNCCLKTRSSLLPERWGERTLLSGKPLPIHKRFVLYRHHHTIMFPLITELLYYLGAYVGVHFLALPSDIVILWAPNAVLLIALQIKEL